MKIVAYTHFGKNKFGLVTDDRILELGPFTDLLTMFRLIREWRLKSSDFSKERILSDQEMVLLASLTGSEAAGGPPSQDFLQDQAEIEAISRHLERSDTLALDEVRLLPPVRHPQKIICIGLNYLDHCRENKLDPPKNPVIFAKYPTALTGGGSAIVKPSITEKLDYEAELAVVIGKTGKKIPEARAMEYVAGYTAMNDVSARDLQFGDGQWTRGKTSDTFAPLGPWLVTPDEIDDPHNLAIRCRLNGDVVQDSRTSEMIFKIPALISFISQSITLLPGDIISTGTPSGVGTFRKPPLYMKDGDLVKVEIEGIGTLANRVVDEEKNGGR